ncbi:MAG: hypothetical protein ABL901_15150 [Hyphomicrobiaceae bacterium]
MRVLRLLISVSLLGLAASVAQADGARRKGVALPAPQPSVAVTVERGVRVWRPLGTGGGDYYPQTASVNAGFEPSAHYVMPNGHSAIGVYGGFGGFSKGKTHERLNGAAFVSKHINVNIKGWGARPHGFKAAQFAGRHHGGMNGRGGAKQGGFGAGGGSRHAVIAGRGGGARHGGGHGRGHH